MKLLEGKVGLVVGIANERSYAWHIAKSIVDHGGTCAFAHLPGDKNERRTRRAIEEMGLADPFMISMDAGNDADIDAAFAKYAEKHDLMHYLVHSIAYADREWLQLGKFTDTPRAAFLNAIDISAYTLAAMTRRARPLLARAAAASGDASVMAMSYYGAEKVIPGYNVMGVAKAALECTARYLATELGGENIRVNIISGGYLRTLASSAVGGTDIMGDRSKDRAPLRRNVEGSDVGKTAVYLASDLSSGVTGETIYVDCGVNIIGG
jgi:enoyl-[acyl-carrier protein] reductase I